MLPVEVSGTAKAQEVDIELRRYDGGTLAKRNLAQQRIPTGGALRSAPDWERLTRSKFGQVLAKVDANGGTPRRRRS